MKKKTIKKLIAGCLGALAALAVVTINSHKVQTKMIENYKEPVLSEVPQEKWNALSQKTIFFAHMSVGKNILDGLCEVLSQQSNITLKISDKYTQQHFCDAMLGHNADPLGKIASFQIQIRQLETPPDIAFMKFCYVDFFATTDAKEVFDAYQKMITELQAEFPNTTFMHCTVPLTAGPQSSTRKVKEIIKSILGKTVTADDNAKRAEFSELIKQTYQPDTIFDIAQYEYTAVNGKHAFKMKKGHIVPFLLSEYTTDGGHLNEFGSRRVAEQLLIKLANCPDQAK